MNPQLIETEDGSHSIHSHIYGVSYHSRHGAIQETQHVFIDKGLKFKSLSLNNIDVLDIGFGTGLNAFMTYLEAERLGLTINYVGVEAFPLDMDTIKLLNYPELLGENARQSQFLAMHQAEWHSRITLDGRFNFTKLHQKFEEISAKEAYDLIYFDAFDPGTQPELWGEELFALMYEALREGGVLVTYCAKGIVKRTLKSLGFKLEALPGPPGKREMTRAVK